VDARQSRIGRRFDASKWVKVRGKLDRAPRETHGDAAASSELR
jgi:hypothetical protein